QGVADVRAPLGISGKRNCTPRSQDQAGPPAWVRHPVRTQTGRQTAAPNYALNFLGRLNRSRPIDSGSANVPLGLNFPAVSLLNAAPAFPVQFLGQETAHVSAVAALVSGHKRRGLDRRRDLFTYRSCE